jgi:hypothetical protein
MLMLLIPNRAGYKFNVALLFFVPLRVVRVFVVRSTVSPALQAVLFSKIIRASNW